jgi:DMSO/TMAO reductase YedYZ molybdopterin-dependent catalytic subunit
VKDLPLDRVRTDDALLAYEVNGDPLPPENGYPVRLVVPGFYGTNSVKWLHRMVFADRRADSPFTTRFYNDEVGGVSSPVWAVAPESVIVQPSNSDILEEGSRVVIWGWAWAHDPVASVEVSVDGGTSWRTARISGRTDHGWHRFEIEWLPNSAGPAVLCSRATDCRNRSQPSAGARNAVHCVPVTLQSAPGSSRLL